MTNNIPFIRSVLHTTDFSAASNRAFAHALAIALLRQTELTILHVTKNGRQDVPWNEFPQIRKTLERWNLLEPGSPRSAVYEQLAIEVRKLAVKGSNPVGPTVRFLEQQPHDLVVLATEGGAGGAPDWLHESAAEGISRGSGAMTLFVPTRAVREIVKLEDGDLNLRHILVAVDPDIGPEAAIEFARRAAEMLGDGDVEIVLLHVGGALPELPLVEDDDCCTWSTELRQGDIPETILAAAEDRRSDLIVMTTNGRDTLGQALKGSTTDRVLRDAKCPVLAVPERR